MEKIVKDNVLIAEFMGIRYEENRSGHESSDCYYEDIELEYHTSWSWLIPVVKEIQSVTEEPEELDTLRDTLWWGSVKNVFTEVVDIIKRINSGEIERVRE